MLRRSGLRQLIRLQHHSKTRRPAFSVSQRSMVETKELQVSSDSSVETITTEATQLVDSHGWTVCHDGKGLERSFKFKGFKAAWVCRAECNDVQTDQDKDFMNHVAAECKKQKHHPEWTNIYNQTRIRWTTHNPEGLSAKDTHMARFCDEAAQQHGEVAETKQHSKDWESNARDCCSGSGK